MCTVLVVIAFIGFLALQVPGMGLDEGAHITHAEKLRQGHLASHDDTMSPELSSAIRCDRYRVWGSSLNPGYPTGSRYECFTPPRLAEFNGEFNAQQAQQTPVYYGPLALAVKVVDKVTDLDPLVDTYRVAGLMFTVLSVVSLLWLGARLRVSPSIVAAGTLVIVGTSGFVLAHSFVSNDALAIPAGVALLLAARRVADSRSSAWLLVAVSFAVALAKPTFLPGHLACAFYIMQRLEPAKLRLRDQGVAQHKQALDLWEKHPQAVRADHRSWHWCHGGYRRVSGVGRALRSRLKKLSDYYFSRIFQADYLKDIVNTLQNPLTQERPISLMDPTYGLAMMAALEAVVLWGTVLVAMGFWRRGDRDPARLGRSAIGAIFLGAVVLFLQSGLRGNALSSTNTRYLLPVVPFMFGAIVMTADQVWGRLLPKVPKLALPLIVVLMLGVQVIAVDHTSDPQLNNAWTRRQAGVLASFINEEVAPPLPNDADGASKPCIRKGDTVAVIPYMPGLYDMVPGIKAPTDSDTYWVGSLPRKTRRAPFEALTDSDVDVVIVSSPLYVNYERTGAARVADEWPRCARWMPLGLGLTHPPFEVYVRLAES